MPLLGLVSACVGQRRRGTDASSVVCWGVMCAGQELCAERAGWIQRELACVRADGCRQDAHDARRSRRASRHHPAVHPTDPRHGQCCSLQRLGIPPRGQHSLDTDALQEQPPDFTLPMAFLPRMATLITRSNVPCFLGSACGSACLPLPQSFQFVSLVAPFPPTAM